MANEKLDLIDRQAFIEDIKTEIMNLYLDGLKGIPRPRSELYDIIDRINEQPTVDAVEVVHGRWNELDSAADYQCSVCGFRFTSGDPISMFPYCRCGAKMDGERKDNEN